ncbi:hypothetical protein R3P38DRAFT_273430 [Favolaschia claudopus]|uniref:Uncharacterized protein n=1 Tax=Favolaschia claudopus TaxID=2862362 RepID=A0AAV9ZQ20_9AGAR
MLSLLPSILTLSLTPVIFTHATPRRPLHSRTPPLPPAVSPPRSPIPTLPQCPLRSSPRHQRRDIPPSNAVSFPSPDSPLDATSLSPSSAASFSNTPLTALSSAFLPSTLKFSSQLTTRRHRVTTNSTHPSSLAHSTLNPFETLVRADTAFPPLPPSSDPPKTQTQNYLRARLPVSTPPRTRTSPESRPSPLQ